jgi:predicted dehydrogenase
MPGGVMLQIGLHYVDVLMMLLGPVKTVSGMASQLVLPGDNPDVGTIMMTHENGAVSSLSTSYASASEYYLMNVYGKRMSAYYNLFDGLRCLKQGEAGQTAVAVEKVDTLAEEIIEWAEAARGVGAPEVGGEGATESLAVVKAGIKSVREGRHVDVAEILASDD